MNAHPQPPPAPEPVDFFAVLNGQRACRAFSDEPVSDEVVERILEAATHAPSAENTQPWVFIVIRDAEARARIGALTAAAWNRSGRELSRDRLSPELLADVDRGATGGVAGAPVLVVVAGDATRCVESALAASVFPAIQNLLLAANACGMGSALTTLPTLLPEMSTDLGLPDSLRPMAVVPLGYPARPLGAPRRVPVAKKAHRERFGDPW